MFPQTVNASMLGMPMIGIGNTIFIDFPFIIFDVLDFFESCKTNRWTIIKMDRTFRAEQ